MSETRSLMQAPELRFAGDGSAGQTVAGYAAVFNSAADIGGMWREVISPGAFRQSIARDDVLALNSHETDRLLGRTSSGTLRLREDEKGLAVEIDLPDTSDGRDVGALVRRGDLKGMSIGFIVRKETWDETVNPPLRTIEMADLIEVSAVARPAYGDTTLGLRSLDRARAEKDRDQAERNRAAAEARIAERKARMEQSFRGIRPDTSR
jgi:HK97 family phage prohead protease